jgi:UDP:flavonoid glycosyltransferase YjiC (YdhE family)
VPGAPLKVLIVPFGAAGDVHPLVGLGRALGARGHEVTVVTHGWFEPLVRGAGLGFLGYASADEFLALTEVPGTANVAKAFRVMVERAILPLVPRLFALLRDAFDPGRTVVVAQPLAFAARIAQEALGVPLATLHLHPFFLRSARDPLLFPAHAPPVLKRLVHRAIDGVVDLRIGRALNAFRAGLGLAPVHRLAQGWWNSPELVLALFPEWLARRQPDWPAQTVQTGFVLWDAGDAMEVPDGLGRFLDAGSPPVVFAAPSWMRHAQPFFAAAAEACGLSGRRGLLLTRFPEQLPARLPDGVRHFGFVPYRALLPRAAALAHHGGMGTLAFALAAGIPQLVSPIHLDHPHNAALLVELGVASRLAPRAWRPAAVARALDDLLASPRLAERCRAFARQVDSAGALANACSRIEALARSG